LLYPRYPVLIVLSWLSCPAMVVSSQLSCSSCPVPAMMFRPPCPLSYSAWPILTVFSGSLVLTVLNRLSGPGRHAPAFLSPAFSSPLSCLCCHVLILLYCVFILDALS
jgi:hypothetical protein